MNNNHQWPDRGFHRQSRQTTNYIGQCGMRLKQHHTNRISNADYPSMSLHVDSRSSDSDGNLTNAIITAIKPHKAASPRYGSASQSLPSFIPVEKSQASAGPAAHAPTVSTMLTSVYKSRRLLGVDKRYDGGPAERNKPVTKRDDDLPGHGPSHGRPSHEKEPARPTTHREPGKQKVLLY